MLFKQLYLNRKEDAKDDSPHRQSLEQADHSLEQDSPKMQEERKLLISKKAFSASIKDFQPMSVKENK